MFNPRFKLIPFFDHPISQEMETDKNEDDEKKKKKGEVSFFFKYKVHDSKNQKISPLCPSAPKCGFIKGNEKVMLLLERVKPEIVALRETIIAVSRPRDGFPRCQPFRRSKLSVSVAAGLLLDPAPHSKN